MTIIHPAYPWWGTGTGHGLPVLLGGLIILIGLVWLIGIGAATGLGFTLVLIGAFILWIAIRSRPRFTLRVRTVRFF